MFVKSLHLYNWLSHADNLLEFEKLVSIRGENGAGKSSVEQALEMLFTGRSASTQDNGSGSRDLIRRDQDKCAITAEIQDTTLLGTRTAKMRCSVTEKSGRTIIIKDPDDPAWTGSEFLASLAMKREILDCLINGRYFVEMDDARQKKLLAGIILPATAKWEDWVEKAMLECELRVDWSMKAFDVIALAYEAAYNERKLVTRLLKEWREPEAVAVQEIDAQAIRTRLAERQKQRTELAIGRNTELGKWQRAHDARGKIGGKIQGLEVRLATEQSKRADVAKGELSKAALKEATKLAAAAEKGKKIEADIQANNAALAEVRRTLAKLNDVGEAGTCPTCTQPVTDAEFENITAPFIKRQDELLKAERDLQDARKSLGDYDGAARVLADHAQAERNLALVDEHIAGIEKDIADLQKEQAEAGNEDTQPDTAEIDKQIADLDGRIEKGNAALTAAIQADSAREGYAKAMEAKKKLDAKQALLERLVEYFGPKGVQAKLLNEHVGGFEGSMNKVLDKWGFQAKLQFDPFAFSLMFAGKDKAYNLRTISKSQKHSFSIAFQVALAKVSGLNFVVVDEADVFLDANRGKLYQALDGAGLDQVIVLQSDSRREIPAKAGRVFYMLSLDRSGEVPTTRVERL